MFKKFATTTLVLLFSVLFAAPAFAFSPSDLFNTNWFQNLVNRVENKTNGQVTEQQIKKHVTKKWTNRKMATRSGEMKNMVMGTAFLDKLVSEGKITSAQKEAIIAEMKTLKEKYGEGKMKDLTKEQKQEKMKEMQAEIKTFLETQGIDIKGLFPMGMMPLKQKGMRPPVMMKQ